MCEATCVVYQLKYLRADLNQLVGRRSRKRDFDLAVEVLQARIDGLIRQLEHFGEGQQWADPDALLRSSTDKP